MRATHPAIPTLVLAAALAAGCVVAPAGAPPALPAPTAPALTPASPGAGGAPAASADAVASYIAVFTVGLRAADAGIQVYNRVNAKATASRLALLQADEDADAEGEADADDEDVAGDGDGAEADDEGPDADDDGEVGDDEDDEDAEAFLDEEWDDEEFDDWAASLEDEEWLDLDEDEVVERIEDSDFEDLDGAEGGDRRLKQRIDVAADEIAGDTGDVAVEEIVDPTGHVREGKLTYTPDADADAYGLAPQTITYDVPAAHEATGNEVAVKVETGAGEVNASVGQVLKYGSSTAEFTEKVLPSGAVVLNGTVKTDTGLTLDLAGEARPDGARDFTVTGGGYAIVFKDVKDLGQARGFVLDKAPDAPDAKVVSTIAASETAPATFQPLAIPLDYAVAKAQGMQDHFARIQYELACASPGTGVEGLQVDVRPAPRAAGRDVASRMTVDVAGDRHAVAVTGRDAPVMAEAPDAYRATDLATGATVAVALDQEGASFLAGEGAARVAVDELPTGGLLVAGRPAGSPHAAGIALARTPYGAAASIHALAGLRATLAGLPAEATRSSCPTARGGSYQVQARCPGPGVVYPGYRVLLQVLDAWLEARQAR